MSRRERDPPGPGGKRDGSFREKAPESVLLLGRCQGDAGDGFEAPGSRPFPTGGLRINPEKRGIVPAFLQGFLIRRAFVPGH